MKKGFTLVEVLVGTFLMLVVFLGIIGAYRTGVKLIGLSKNKAIATAIATGQIEKIKNLSYELIGVAGSFPDGILVAVSTTTQNAVEFTIERRVDYVVDTTDGVSMPEDSCPNDYKKVEIRVSWAGIFGGNVTFSTDISPKNFVQECDEAGGVLSVSVFDAFGVMVPSPFIEVKNPLTDELIKSATPADGQYYFSLPASSTYKVLLSKNGYSSERTYGIEEVVTPERPHLIILENQLTQSSFSIDKTSSFLVDTVSPWGLDIFYDSFNNENKIFATSSSAVVAGEINLALDVETGYADSGYVISQTVTPEYLDKWSEFSWDDLEESGTTTIKYQLLYFDGFDWVPIPDSDLAGNGDGFGNSPVDLISLSTTTYSKLRLKADLITVDASTTPAVLGWEISWFSVHATPVADVTFNLKGNKIIGYDTSEEKVYKYSVDHTTNSNGHKDISVLEWDTYTFSVEPSLGLDLIGIDPSPQPIGLSPDTDLSVKLYLDAQRSLLLTVKDLETLGPIFSAEVRLRNEGLGYDKIQYTNEKGQTYFIPLTMATYNLEIQAPGYLTALASVYIGGDTTKIIKLERLE